MMKFELGLDKPDPARARTSAVTIAVSYIVGGLVPLASYFIVPSVGTALVVSALVTVLALLVFGYVKGTLTGKKPFPQCLADGGRRRAGGRGGVRDCEADCVDPADLAHRDEPEWIDLRFAFEAH
jgi:VIT family protein